MKKWIVALAAFIVFGCGENGAPKRRVVVGRVDRVFDDGTVSVLFDDCSWEPTGRRLNGPGVEFELRKNRYRVIAETGLKGLPSEGDIVTVREEANGTYHVAGVSRAAKTDSEDPPEEPSR